MQNTRQKPLVMAVFALLVIALAVGLWWRQRDKNSAGTAADNRQTTTSLSKRIAVMFEAAQEGDVERYLSCLTEPMLSRMKSRADAAFSAKLRRSEEQLQSFSIIQRTLSDDAQQATLVIEKIYPEHQERYSLRLRKTDGEWKIADLRGLNKSAPRIKFGTPVFPEKKRAMKK